MQDLLFLSIKDKIPTSSYIFVKDRLANASEAEQNAVSVQTLKDPIIGLILSLLLGSLGVDRFYKGNILLGILKLITFGAFGIWTIIDWFLIMGGIKKDNLKKISTALSYNFTQH